VPLSDGLDTRPCKILDRRLRAAWTTWLRACVRACVPGRDSEADDPYVQQTGEEAGGRDVPLDPGVHGRPQEQGRGDQHDGRRARRGRTRVVCRRPARRDLHPAVSTDHQEPTRVRAACASSNC